MMPNGMPANTSYYPMPIQPQMAAAPLAQQVPLQQAAVGTVQQFTPMGWGDHPAAQQITGPTNMPANHPAGYPYPTGPTNPMATGPSASIAPGGPHPTLISR
jgi:hypothetical protein